MLKTVLLLSILVLTVSCSGGGRSDSIIVGPKDSDSGSPVSDGSNAGEPNQNPVAGEEVNPSENDPVSETLPEDPTTPPVVTEDNNDPSTPLENQVPQAPKIQCLVTVDRETSSLIAMDFNIGNMTEAELNRYTVVVKLSGQGHIDVIYSDNGGEETLSDGREFSLKPINSESEFTVFASLRDGKSNHNNSVKVKNAYVRLDNREELIYCVVDYL